MNKIPSEIIRIDLNEASFEGTGAYMEPTYVNFVFGNNGTGKSTIARAIQSGNGVTYASGRSGTDYLPLVFNQEFIDQNVRSYRGMNGVFTLNEKNDKIQGLIDDKNEELKKQKEALATATETKDKKKSAKDKLKKDFDKSCWDKEKEFRENFPKTQEGKGKSEPFMRAVNAHSPKDMDLEEFQRLYDSAFSDAAKRYSRFAEIVDVDILDGLEGEEILSVSIVNSADTELAKFLKEIGSTEWVRQGHDDYSDKADGRCPYCARKLPDGFEQTFIDSFDTKYQENLRKLDAFLELYRNTANSLFLSIQTIPNEVYPQIKSTKPYSDKLAVLKAAIQGNIDTIKKKQEEPAAIVEITKTREILQELSEIIKGFNQLIDDNNAIVDAGPKKRDECTDMAFSYLAFKLKDDIAAYKKSEDALSKEINDLESETTKHSQSIETIKSELKDLQKGTVETDTAKDRINKLLYDSGMRGFSLQPKEGVQHVYEVRRSNDEIADNLSEGEKNFIAFLYFYYLVLGSTSEDGDAREKIVVIDDPVSSMDSGSLFIVSTLVHRMIEICRNNADNRNKTVDGNFIKQIFVLTHNAYFHREITHGYVEKYEYASFYLIKKFDTKSSIKMKDEVNPDIPTERRNVNPVKNSYAALWDEYKEVKSAVPLMNVIRRILEYYFIQLCGYDGTTLCDRILVQGKDEGKFKNDDGTENDEKFQIASAMLSYINTSSMGLSDGMDFIEEFLDMEECKIIFEMIFEVMQQKQHFNMMTGNK